MKKYKFDKPVQLKCWLCKKTLLSIRSSEVIEFSIIEAPEGYDLELYCPDCQKSCMFSFNEKNENYYNKNRS